MSGWKSLQFSRPQNGSFSPSYHALIPGEEKEEVTKALGCTSRLSSHLRAFVVSSYSDFCFRVVSCLLCLNGELVM